MQIVMSFLHLDGTPSIEEKIREKAARICRPLGDKAEIHWTCGVRKDCHYSEVNLHAGSHHFHAHAENDNLYKTFDQVAAKLSKQIEKEKKSRKGKGFWSLISGTSRT